ncbi:YciI family protein [Nakamurella endophytica]|uniref:YCII-related domain-containing protein n=1 Tax=Nakamurella endophytica TaxID=1748367 RepID=A0A917T1V8_9ACTN|nr:YciI family protein [Nakamurella endophytica]GGM06462.1 hypothetical protein GCM10011594_28180 [Nakamurella endophytica]
MPLFAVLYTYGEHTDQLRDEHRPAHRAFLRDLADPAGTVVMLSTGPFTDVPGALLVAQGPDAAAVERALDEDPFLHIGAIAERRVHGWSPVSGPWAS